ncbi:MAG: hypothetical protein P8P99_00040 [Maricaulis sp.]|jgi:hypothetical protein|nr:hypothetical protein [Maricaulis sp.]
MTTDHSKSWQHAVSLTGLFIGVLAVWSSGASAQTIHPEALQLPAARSLTHEALAPGTRENPQTEEVIVVVDSTGHSWLACGTQAQIEAQRTAHEAHGHNHDFHGPCPGQGIVSSDLNASAGAADSDSASSGSDEMTETDTNTGNCTTSNHGAIATNCQSAPALAGQQVRQQLRQHLPRLTRPVQRADDQDDDN